MKDYTKIIDLHMHTNISDGSDTPSELLQKIKAAGVSVFSVTDHDSIKSADIIKGLLNDNSLTFISGVEFSCKDKEGKYHILGYGYDTKSKELNQVVEYGHSLRINKLFARLDFIKNEFGFGFLKEDVDALLALDNPGKPHIGNLMIKYGYAKTIKEAMTEYLDKVHFYNEYLLPEDAINGIIAAGGIPVLAHPFYGSGDELILGKDIEDRILKLKNYGLKGVEAFYSGFTDKLREEMLSLAKKHNLFVTAGSDYHGANKLVKLGDTGLNNIFKEELLPFLEAVT